MQTMQKVQQVLSAEEQYLAKEILKKVLDCMREDESPDFDYTDGGRFILSLTKKQVNSLKKIIKKL